jgi:hypothetical protein
MKKLFSLIVLSILLRQLVPNALAEEPAAPITTEQLLGIAPDTVAPIGPVPASEPVAPDSTAATEPAAPDTISPTQPASDTEKKPISLEKSIANNNEKKDSAEKSAWKYGSVMFTQKSMVEINAAVRSVTEGIPLEILLPNYFVVEKAVEPVKPTAAEISNVASDAGKSAAIVAAAAVSVRTYYLKSILYFAPDNWTLWLNDKKISYGDSISDISFANVTSDFAVVLWRQADPDKLFPSWKSSFTSLGNDTWASAKKNIVINSVTGDISFIIKPNQSFMSDIMEIVEGPVSAAVASETKAGSGAGKEGDSSEPSVTKTASRPTATPAAPKMENELNSPNMKQYLNQINILQSVLSSAAPTDKSTTPNSAPN